MSAFDNEIFGLVWRNDVYRLLLGCLVFLLTALCALNGQSLTASGELVSVVKPQFEIYAPRQTDLPRAVEALEQARRIYKQYFGKDAPKIAVVLYDKPEQTQAYDEAAFRNRGLALLKWNALTLPSKIARFDSLGALLTGSPADSRPQVLALYPEGAVAGIDLRSGDVLLSVNSHPVRTVEDARREMSVIAVGVSVTVGIERGGRRSERQFVRPEPNPKSITPGELARIASESGKIPISRSTIAHEAMHKLVREGLRENLGSNNILPAWFSEGMASLAEFPAEREASRKFIREKLKERIELFQLFRMLHPATQGMTSAPSASTPESGGLTRTIRVELSAGEQAFYQQNMTLLEFLAEKEGKRFVGQIGEELARGKRMEDILRLARVAPRDLTGLDTAWSKWLTQ